MAKAQTQSEPVSWSFPKAGWDTSAAFGKQPNRPLTQKSEYGRTSALAVNVRGFEPGTNRMRGGSRLGLVKWNPLQAAGEEWVLQSLELLVTVDPGAVVQSSQSGRVVQVVAVSKGQVVTATAGDTTWTTPANNTGETPPLNITGLMFAACNNQIMYFADGVNWVKYVPSTNSLETWAATAGVLPVDNENNLPRLIENWRSRIVLSGLVNDPQNWFMSAVDDPTDFDYSPLSTSPTQAVAGNDAPAGLIGDVITGMIPYTSDVMIFLGDHSIYMMRGDPMAGGQIDLVTNSIGGAFGRAWCMDPYGTVYFFSNRCGIYSLIPGMRPQRISQPIESFVQNVDTGANSIRMIWNDRQQALHVFITPLAAPAPSTHLCFEGRQNAWWQDQYANENHNPLCCCTFDGNTPGDRAVLVGGWDGFVRELSMTATRDDGYDISSEVVIGPLTTKNLDDMMIYSAQAVLGTDSGTVTFAVYLGRTAEEALSNTPIMTGTWGAGRNFTNSIRRAGHAIYIKLSATSPWALESIRLMVATQGKVRQRGA